jgi:hypothetical protein
LIKVGTWIVAPMEVRIMQATVPSPPKITHAPLPELDEPADSAALHALTAHFIGTTEWSGDTVLTVRDVLRRNAQQDMLLAHSRRSPLLWFRTADHFANRWGVFPTGAEWYLRIRDLLISQPRP